MSSIITIILIGISLSMDAFSLSLIYGMMDIPNTKFLPIIVGLFHFIMPIIGLSLGTIIDNISFINLEIIASIILVYIGLDLIISNFKIEEKTDINTINLIMLALSVSIDSLTIGIGLKAITSYSVLAPLIFALLSLIFTYIGLLLGNAIGKKIGMYSKIVGGIILVIIATIMIIE